MLSIKGDVKDLGMVKISDLVNIRDALVSGTTHDARLALEQQLDMLKVDWKKLARFK